MHWVDKDTEIYCSFAKKSGNTGCQMMNTAFRYYKLNKIYKSFSVDDIGQAVSAVRTLGIKGFAITMPYKREVLNYVDSVDTSAAMGAANTVLNSNGVLKAYNTDYMAACDYLSGLAKKDRLYIVGDGGYSAAVQAAASKQGFEYALITRDNWQLLGEVENSIIYNCTPVEKINKSVSGTNTFIDCLVNTPTGKTLATLQASYQFSLYTGLKFPLGGQYEKDLFC